MIRAEHNGELHDWFRDRGVEVTPAWGKMEKEPNKATSIIIKSLPDSPVQQTEGLLCGTKALDPEKARREWLEGLQPGDMVRTDIGGIHNVYHGVVAPFTGLTSPTHPDAISQGTIYHIDLTDPTKIRNVNRIPMHWRQNNHGIHELYLRSVEPHEMTPGQLNRHVSGELNKPVPKDPIETMQMQDYAEESGRQDLADAMDTVHKLKGHKSIAGEAKAYEPQVGHRVRIVRAERLPGVNDTPSVGKVGTIVGEQQSTVHPSGIGYIVQHDDEECVNTFVFPDEIVPHKEVPSFNL